MFSGRRPDFRQGSVWTTSVSESELTSCWARKTEKSIWRGLGTAVEQKYISTKNFQAVQWIILGEDAIHFDFHFHFPISTRTGLNWYGGDPTQLKRPLTVASYEQSSFESSKPRWRAAQCREERVERVAYAVATGRWKWKTWRLLKLWKLNDSFSAVSKPILQVLVNTKFSFESSWRDQSDLHASSGRKEPRLKMRRWKCTSPTSVSQQCLSHTLYVCVVVLLVHNVSSISAFSIFSCRFVLKIDLLLWEIQSVSRNSSKYRTPERNRWIYIFPTSLKFIINMFAY